MAKEDLMREIDIAFEEAGEKEGWMYETFKSLLRLNQLSHFQIFEMNWFPGAQRILDLIDQLHTLETSKNDFLEIGKLLNIEIDPRLSKEVVAEKVKGTKSWRAKSFELDALKKMDSTKKRLEPLYAQLKLYGYTTDLLPRQIEYKRWILDAFNQDGVRETLYLNESDSEKLVMIQSNKVDFICVVSAVDTGLIELI